MEFDTGTWWLVGIIVTMITGALVFLIKQSVFGKIDKIENRVEYVEKNYLLKTDLKSCKDDIKQVKENYTPLLVHEKDYDECKNDIKKMKAEYITKEDFFRELNKVDMDLGKLDKKIDYITDILIQDMKGRGKN